MQRHKTVDEYIAKKSEWQSELMLLRQIMIECGLEETVKWGGPVYMLNEKNVSGLGAFKEYVAIWFFQGALLKDEHKKLVNAQEGRTKALRQWRFPNLQAVEADRELIAAYVKEAKANTRQGREIKADRSKPVIIPAELAKVFEKQSELKASFDRLSKGRQREYAEYISEAKREETRQKRLEKIVPMILGGIGLNDKYKR